MQVQIQEDDGGAMHLRNLSMHRCDTEEQALNMVRRLARAYAAALCCPPPPPMHSAPLRF